MMDERKPVLTPEVPPDRPDYPGNARMDWKPIADQLKRQPGQWMRLTHEYKSDHSARASLYAQSKRYGFEYHITTASPQADGRPGVFVRWPEGKE